MCHISPTPPFPRSSRTYLASAASAAAPQPPMCTTGPSPVTPAGTVHYSCRYSTLLLQYSCRYNTLPSPATPAGPFSGVVSGSRTAAWRAGATVGLTPPTGSLVSGAGSTSESTSPSCSSCPQASFPFTSSPSSSSLHSPSFPLSS